MSEQRIDHAAGAATSRPDEAQGAGHEEVSEQEDVPATEGARQVAETVQSISRLEESN